MRSVFVVRYRTTALRQTPPTAEGSEKAQLRACLACLGCELSM